MKRSKDCVKRVASCLAHFTGLTEVALVMKPFLATDPPIIHIRFRLKLKALNRALGVPGRLFRVESTGKQTWIWKAEPGQVLSWTNWVD
jgi:hypothetical protein